MQSSSTARPRKTSPLARVILCLALLFFISLFALFVRFVVVTVHPPGPTPEKPSLFQIKDLNQLEEFHKQVEDLTIDALEIGDIVLVTGGSGFIGSHVVDALLHEGYQVIVFDHHEVHENRQGWKMKVGQEELPTYIHILGSVLNPQDFEKIPDVPIRFVIHCAGIGPPNGFTADSHADDEVDKQGVMNMLSFLNDRSIPVDRFICFSSTDVYGATSMRFLPFKDNMAHNPMSKWAQRKSALETALKSYAFHSDISILVLRLATVYGPRQKREDGLINQMVFESAEGKPISLPLHGLFTRDVMFVGDLAKVVLIAFRFPKGGLQFADVGSCHMTSLNDIAKEVLSVTYSSQGTRNLPVEPDVTYQEVAENELVPFRGMQSLRIGLGVTFENVKDRLQKELKVDDSPAPEK